MKIKPMFILGAMVWVGMAGPGWAANYFSWDADSLTTSIGVCGNNQISGGQLDTQEKHLGTSSMRLTIPGGQQFSMGCQDLGAITSWFTRIEVGVCRYRSSQK